MADGKSSHPPLTPEEAFKAAQKILAPYKFEYKYCDWWSVYRVSLIAIRLFRSLRLIDWATNLDKVQRWGQV